MSHRVSSSASSVGYVHAGLPVGSEHSEETESSQTSQLLRGAGAAGQSDQVRRRLLSGGPEPEAASGLCAVQVAVQLTNGIPVRGAAAAFHGGLQIR